MQSTWRLRGRGGLQLLEKRAQFKRCFLLAESLSTKLSTIVRIAHDLHVFQWLPSNEKYCSDNQGEPTLYWCMYSTTCGVRFFSHPLYSLTIRLHPPSNYSAVHIHHASQCALQCGDACRLLLERLLSFIGLRAVSVMHILRLQVERGPE